MKKSWILPRYLAKVRDWVGTWALEEIQHHPCSQGIPSSTRCIFGIPTISHEIPTHHDIKSGIRGIYSWDIQIYMRFVLHICCFHGWPSRWAKAYELPRTVQVNRPWNHASRNESYKVTMAKMLLKDLGHEFTRASTLQKEMQKNPCFLTCKLRQS